MYVIVSVVSLSSQINAHHATLIRLRLPRRGPWRGRPLSVSPSSLLLLLHSVLLSASASSDYPVPLAPIVFRSYPAAINVVPLCPCTRTARTRASFLFSSVFTAKRRPEFDCRKESEDEREREREREYSRNRVSRVTIAARQTIPVS